MKAKNRHSFESYWRNAPLESAFHNAEGYAYWALKRQAKKAYEAGRRHEKLKSNAQVNRPQKAAQGNDNE